MEERLQAVASRPTSAGETVSAQPQPPTLTVCILAGDDEQIIGDCLARVRPFAEEVIVGLVNCQDRTREVALEYRARIYDLDWSDSFAGLRNKLLLRATKDWILSLDAHEFIDDASMHQIRQAIQEVPEQTFGLGVSVQTQGDEEPALKSDVRVFRNRNEIVFAHHGCETVDECILALGGQIVELPVTAIASNGSSDFDVQIHGSETRHRLMQLDAKQQQENASVWFRLGKFHLQHGNPFHAECYLAESRQRISPGHRSYSELMFDLITAHRQKGDLHRALEASQEALQHVPDKEHFVKVRDEVVSALNNGGGR